MAALLVLKMAVLMAVVDSLTRIGGGRDWEDEAIGYRLF
jgi:hypothetical protein